MQLYRFTTMKYDMGKRALFAYVNNKVLHEPKQLCGECGNVGFSTEPHKMTFCPGFNYSNAGEYSMKPTQTLQCNRYYLCQYGKCPKILNTLFHTFLT